MNLNIVLTFNCHHNSCPPQVGPLERELWEAEGEEDGHASGYGDLHSSITTTVATSTATSAAAAAGGDAEGTATPETDTGTDFGLLGSYVPGKGNTQFKECCSVQAEIAQQLLDGLSLNLVQMFVVP